MNYMGAFQYVWENGKQRGDRTGIGTRSVFGINIRYDLAEGFPLITEKKTWWKGVVTELQWILKGDRTGNIDFMRNRGVHIWDEWADENGDLGPVYGAQARAWTGPTDVIDQLSKVVYQLKTNPESRRHVVSMWNPGELDQQALPPCHLLYQFYVQDGKLSTLVYQRSADMFLGVPFDIASYALLTHIVANLAGLEVGELIYNLGDAHIYDNHVDQAELLLKRAHDRPLPTLVIPQLSSLEQYVALPFSAFQLEGYNPYPTIGAEVAV